MNKDEFKKLIDERFSVLQGLLDKQIHLSDPETVAEAMNGITKFYSQLSEEDREFIQGVRIAIKDKINWT